ncbi:substrate-binding domain-containing protein [Bailinhaonella thermotolerans]|uniref:DeoR family transcriptional regulator n=1 Tax=Bailinhaonella thermotolerans TaxID=1070861 RepID=A0A3A4AA77_9ACTN|nr:substrate-binding domain-containing protein [Bailinhaonella thermotolerans]RJL23274.1 DeoR family transcriptional regulator [Bailinhaonella thermotolerans]
MVTDERHEAILRLLRLEGSIKVSEVAERLGVSAVTVRHDVRELAGRGLLKRIHGGATLLQGPRAADPAQAPEADAPPAGTRAGQGPVFGMVVPHASYYYPEVIKGAQAAAGARGARVVLSVSRYDLEEDRARVGELLAAGVDGLLLTPRWNPASSAETGRWLESLDVPVILVERRAGFESGDVEQVASDHVFGAYLAVRHLARLGHEHVAMLAREESLTTPWLCEGYERALRSFGLRRAEPRLLLGSRDDDPAGVDAQLEEFAGLAKAEDVRAVLVHNDYDAIELVRRLRARGLDVPRDIALVTYDDEVATMGDVPLTAVAPPKQAVGAEAVELLMRRMGEPAGPRRQVLLRPELRVRASCGADSGS